MRPHGRIATVVVTMFLFLFVTLISRRLEKSLATRGIIPNENTFEFTNNEAEDAYDLHIHWSRAVTIGEVKPFKKKDGNGTNTTDFSNGVVAKTKTASVTVSWDGSTEAQVKEWWWTKKDKSQLGDKKTGNPSTTSMTPNATAKSSLLVSNGLKTVTFDTPPGQVRVNLPDDMMAGDTISGTVVAEPKGQNEAERSKNTAELSGLVIDIAPPKRSGESAGANVKVAVSATTVPFIFKTPPTPPTADVKASEADTVVVRLTNTSGLIVVGTKDVPIEIVSLHLQSVAPIQVQFPTIGQQGRPIEIIGPFDGKITNTKLMYGPKGTPVQDFEKNTENVTGGFGLLQPLAESPRKCVSQAPLAVTGPIELYVKDGKTQATSPYRNVSVNLTAPKTSLFKGEHTELHIEVNGLQGITQSVPLTLDSHGVITMEGGMYQPLVIQPSRVGADGRYTTTRGITGVQTGAWTSTATVVTPPPYILLADPSPPRHLVINSRTGQYAFCNAGEKVAGTGEVKVDGCTFHFFQDSNEKLLMGVLNACSSPGNRYWVFSSGLTYIPVDFRIKVDNANPPKTRVYFNPLNRPAPPVQDVSAFATCP